MNRTFVIGALLAVGGCASQPPEIKQCEDYLLAKLRSPSTYKRINASSVGIPYPEAKQWSVIIEYDAANVYGTPVRDKQICMFPAKNRQADTSKYIDFDQAMSSGTDSMDTMTDNMTAIDATIVD